LLFSADDNEVVVGAERLRVLGKEIGIIKLLCCCCVYFKGKNVMVLCNQCPPLNAYDETLTLSATTLEMVSLQGS
jgi:hypothetical protein